MCYSADPHWALVHDPGLLVLHAGADELFAIEDVSDGVAAEMLALWRTEVMRPEALSQEAAGVFEQLKAAGIVRNLVAARVEYSLAVTFAGERDAALEAALADALPAAIVVDDAGAPDFVLFVRTNGALTDIVGAGYTALTAPHLLLDIAFDHTICLGPLVFPRQTACLHCLVARLSYYWGDVTPPVRPRVSGHPGLSAGLAAIAVQTSSVYRVPSCPACGTGAAARRGSIALPWVGAR